MRRPFFLAGGPPAGSGYFMLFLCCLFYDCLCCPFRRFYCSVFIYSAIAVSHGANLKSVVLSNM